MKVSLPQDAWAVIKSKGEISERVSRELVRTLMESAAVADKLNQAGFDDDKADTYHHFNGLSEAEKYNLNAIQTVLIRSFVSSWSFDTEITDDAIEDLPKPVYEALAKECLDTWTAEESELAPKVDTDA